MEFVITISWTRNGSVEPLLSTTANFRSIDMARAAAKYFASHVPVHSITIEAENGAIFERWCWSDGEWKQQE